jgi:hypothetical protein
MRGDHEWSASKGGRDSELVVTTATDINRGTAFVFVLSTPACRKRSSALSTGWRSASDTDFFANDLRRLQTTSGQSQKPESQGGFPRLRSLKPLPR